SFRFQLQHTALSHVRDILAVKLRPTTTKGDLFDCWYELLHSSLSFDTQFPVGKRNLEPAGCEIAAKDDMPRAGDDINETANASRDMRSRSEARDVDIPLSIDLHEREKAAIESPSLEIGELIRRGDNGLSIHCTAKLETL